MGSRSHRGDRSRWARRDRGDEDDSRSPSMSRHGRRDRDRVRRHRIHSDAEDNDSRSRSGRSDEQAPPSWMKALMFKIDTNTQTLHNLETSLQADMSKMKADLEQQCTRIDSLDRKMAQSAQDQAAELAQIVESQLNESLKSRFEKVESDLANLISRPLARDAPGAAGGQPAPPAEAGLAADRRQVWVGGFPRPLLKRVLEACANDLERAMLQSYKTGLQKVCYNQNKSFAFVFDTVDSAKWFLEQTRTVGIQWFDKKTNVTLPLRARYDAPTHVRAKHRVLGQLWQMCKDHWRQQAPPVQNWQLGCNGFRGNLFLIVDEEIENLFTLKAEDREQWTIEPDYETLLRYRISREMADRMAAAAVDKTS